MNITAKHPQHILAIKQSAVAQFFDTSKDVSVTDFNHFFQAANPHLVIARRQELESNDEFLQIIPYVMVARAESVSNTSDLKFLTYHRPVTGGEPGLHGKVTIGYGGHIDLNDVVCDENSVINLKDTVLTSMRREIFEELGISSEDLGGVVMGYRVITDNGGGVSRVHLGIAFIVTLKTECVINPAVLEIDYAGEFSAAELSELSGEGVSNPLVMENWSKLLVDEVNSNPKLDGTCYFHFPSFSLGGPLGDEV
jgi:predicted NUDIX family phosphoesterase